MEKTIKAIESWLKKPGNTKALLAYKLGYKASNTIDQWLIKRRVPEWREDDILNIVKGVSE